MFNWGDKIKPYIVKIGANGKVTIPKEYRERYHLNEGVDVLLILTDEGILVKRDNIQLRGYLEKIIDSKGFEKDIKELRKHHNFHAKPYK